MAAVMNLTSLRTGLRLMALTLGLAAPLAAAEPAADAPHPVPEAAWARSPAHPRLFATAAQWEEVRARLATDAYAARLFAIVRARAEAILRLPPVEIRQRKRGVLSGSMLEPAREVQRRVLHLAAAARLTGERKFRARALAELRLLTALADWNPAVFLDTAEATLAVAVGYDWLHDGLAPAERDELANAIAAKGLRASFESPAKMLTWVSGTNNWNQVCHGALVIGALAIAEREPTLARRTVQRAIDHLHGSAKAYAPDGVYPEGPGYWAYGTTFHVAMIAALETAIGEGCGLDSFPGFLRTPEYIDQMTAPTGEVFNYADSSAQRGFEPALFWFARRLRQPAAIRWEREHLGTLSARTADARSRFLPLALLWWDPSLQTLPAPAAPPHWKGEGAVPLAVHRSAWDDPRAVFVAIKGGRANVSHGHMDAGSFILEADGVRWAIDPGPQNYTTLYQAGIDAGLWRFTPESPRWTVFRLGAEGHGILRFNDAPPQVAGSATIVRFVPHGPTPYTQIDLGSVYSDQVRAARRGVMLLPDRRVVLQDEWTAKDREARVTWQWLTRAAVTLEPRIAVLREEGETLRLRLVEPAGAEFAVIDPARLLRAHDEPNPGLVRIDVRTTTPAGGAGRIVIVAEPGSATGGTEVVVRALEAW